MDLKQELIDRLGVPENWDKYDYQTQRYSFEDMQEALEDIVKKLIIPVVSNSVICCPQCGNERLESTGNGWYICADRSCDWGDKL